MAKYEVTIHIDEKSADLLAKIIASKAEIVGFKPINEIPILSAGIPGQRRAIYGIKGNDIVRQILSDGKPHNSQEIISTFIKHGFGKNSASPRIYDLVKTGEIKRVGEATYQKVERVRTTKVNTGGEK